MIQNIRNNPSVLLSCCNHSLPLHQVLLVIRVTVVARHCTSSIPSKLWSVGGLCHGRDVPWILHPFLTFDIGFLFSTSPFIYFETSIDALMGHFQRTIGYIGRSGIPSDFSKMEWRISSALALGSEMGSIGLKERCALPDFVESLWCSWDIYRRNSETVDFGVWPHLGVNSLFFTF